MLTYVFAMVPAFLLLVGFAVWARNREARMLTRSLSDCADARADRRLRGALAGPAVRPPREPPLRA